MDVKSPCFFILNTYPVIGVVCLVVGIFHSTLIALWVTSICVIIGGLGGPITETTQGDLWNTVNPLLSAPPGGLMETGGLFYGRGLLQFSKKIISVLYKEPECKVEKAQVKAVGGHAAEDEKQIRTFSWWINHPGSVHTKFYSRNRPLTVVIDLHSPIIYSE